MTELRPQQAAIGIREIVRFWPIVILVMLIALGTTFWSERRQVPSYTATTRVVVTPLEQWDRTFLGISLLRDSGDATRTAATAAAEMNSPRAAIVTSDYLGSGWTPESVAAAVKVSAFEETNVIEIVAQSDDADKAEKLAEGFANATLADRWKTISTQLDASIAAINQNPLDAGIGADNGTNAFAEKRAEVLQALTMVRDAGSDPTMRIESTSLPVRSKQLPIWVVMGVAAAGGLFVGVLVAIGMARLPRSKIELSDEAPTRAGAIAYSTNGES